MTRTDRLAALLADRGFDGVILANLDNLRYLGGYTGHAAHMLICPGGRHLVTDYRYAEQAAAECAGFDVITRNRQTTTLGQSLDALVREHGLKRVAFEEDHTTVGQFRDLEESIGAELVPVAGLVEELRYTKDEAEVASIARAAAIADEALARVLDGILVPGTTERHVWLELERALMDLGSERPAFETILLSGPRSSLPHGAPTERVIEGGDLVLFDFGAVVDGYLSDMTRTVVVGEADARQREVYAAVLESQVTALAAIRAGVTGKEAYLASRPALMASPDAEFAGEGLGHGLGLFLHEQPHMNEICEMVLRENCVVTVEPGIYIPGWGGVRIEDDVVVTKDGCRILTHAPKELLVVG